MGKDSVASSKGEGAAAADKYNAPMLDKDERKKQRRDRVAKALTAAQPGRKQANSADAETRAGLTKGAQQVADSLSHLDKKKARGIETVTAVRVAADDREAQRRIGEEHARQERLQRLQVRQQQTMAHYAG